jgi:hypothetical protein
METNSIDSIFRKAIEHSADFYDSEAEKVKERIWSQVQPNRTISSGIVLIRILAAACVLLVICTTILSVYFMDAKKTIQALNLNNQKLKKDFDLYVQKTDNQQLSTRNSHFQSSDTLVIERKVIIYKPVVEKERIIDTVFVRQQVDMEKEKVQEMALGLKSSAKADSGYQSKATVPDKEILISNLENKELQRRKKFQIRFGGDKGQKNDVPLAFTVNL